MALLTEAMMQALRDKAALALLAEIEYPSGTPDPENYFVANTSNSWTFVNTNDGWVVGGTGGTLTPAITGSAYVITPADSNINVSSISIDGSVDFIIRMDLERTAAGTGFDGVLFFDNSVHGESGSFYKAIGPNFAVGERRVFDLDMSTLTIGGTDWLTGGPITHLRLDLDSSGNGTWIIHSIKVGHYVNSGRETTTIARFWTGVGTLQYNGFDWAGAGQLGSIAPVQRTSDMAIQEVSFTLAGVTAAQVASISDDVRNRSARAWLACLDDYGNVVPDPYLMLIAELDYQKFDAAEDGVGTLTIVGRTGFYTLERALDEIWSPEDQRLAYPLDTGLDYVPLLQNLDLIWAAN